MAVVEVKFMLAAEDMDRAVAFWETAFGFSRRYGDEHWSELDAAGSILALHGGHDGTRRRSGLSIAVDDLAAALAAVRRAGGDIVTEPSERAGEPIVLAEAVDTEGNVFAITTVP